MTARVLFFAPFVLALCACGGGSQSSSTPVLPQERATLITTSAAACRFQPSTISPTVNGSGVAFLADVSGSTAEAWAVGPSDDPNQPLLEHFNGGVWTRVPAPPNLTGGATSVYTPLTSVVRISATDAWAAGYYSAPDGVHPLTLHWDGRQWTKISNSSQFGINVQVLAIGASGSNNVWAVGEDFTPTAARNQLVLVQRWDGSAWHFVGDTGATHGAPHGLVVFGPANVWFGLQIVPNGNLPTIGAYGHWNGSTLITNGLPWLVTDRPASTGSLSAASPTDIWFAGETRSGGPYYAHFDGHHISSYLSIPPPGPPFTVTVAAFRSGYAVAFGGIPAPPAFGAGFASVFNGKVRWHPITSPTPTNGWVINGHALPGTTDLWTSFVFPVNGVASSAAGLIVCPATPPA